MRCHCDEIAYRNWGLIFSPLQARAMICNVELYIKDHPEVAIIDPLDNVHKVLDRYQTYSIIHNSDLEEAGKNVDLDKDGCLLSCSAV
jgi:hypothetical protein